MKTKSAILTIATAMLGLAFTATGASARPPSKSPGVHHFHKQRKAADASIPRITRGEHSKFGSAISSSSNTASNRHMRGGRKAPYFHKQRKADGAAVRSTGKSNRYKFRPNSRGRR